MTNKDWYIIKDFESFVDSTRALVFNSFGKQKNESLEDAELSVLPEEQDELDRILSHNEASLIAKDILKKQTHKITKETRYLVSDISYMEFVNALNHRMVGNILNSLVNKGLVESSFDEQANDFVFWIKEEKPETD